MLTDEKEVMPITISDSVEEGNPGGRVAIFSIVVRTDHPCWMWVKSCIMSLDGTDQHDVGKLLYLVSLIPLKDSVLQSYELTVSGHRELIGAQSIAEEDDALWKLFAVLVLVGL